MIKRYLFLILSILYFSKVQVFASDLDNNINISVVTQNIKDTREKINEIINNYNLNLKEYQYNHMILNNTTYKIYNYKIELNYKDYEKFISSLKKIENIKIDKIDEFDKNKYLDDMKKLRDEKINLKNEINLSLNTDSSANNKIVRSNEIAENKKELSTINSSLDLNNILLNVNLEVKQDVIENSKSYFFNNLFINFISLIPIIIILIPCIIVFIFIIKKRIFK